MSWLKLSTQHTNNTYPARSKTTTYVGNLVYENGALKRVLVEGGYVEGGVHHFFLEDYLGNVRVVANAGGAVVQKNAYYPFGMAFAGSPGGAAGGVGASAADQAKQPYKFGGKELDQAFGLDQYDFCARYYDPATARFTSQDPLAEKRYNISPYAYCSNNPISRIDPTGMLDGDFVNEKGKLLGNDGINDGKMYIIKTTSASFGDDNNRINGAGLSKADVKATTNFITSNSGNTAAFKNDPIAYNNSIQIENSETNRQAMSSAVSLDSGSGGTSPANNREYGGSILNGVVTVAIPGNIANPQVDAYATIMLPSGVTTFHGHPSGNIIYSPPSGTLGGTTTTHNFNQHPSVIDIRGAGSQIHYVFGRGNNTVYIYNSNGVQATLPMNRFVTPRR